MEESLAQTHRDMTLLEVDSHGELSCPLTLTRIDLAQVLRPQNLQEEALFPSCMFHISPAIPWLTISCSGPKLDSIHAACGKCDN